MRVSRARVLLGDFSRVTQINDKLEPATENYIISFFNVPTNVYFFLCSIQTQGVKVIVV